MLDALLIGLLAWVSGGSDSLAVWLLPLFCLAMTLSLSIGPGVKALILSGLVLGSLTALEEKPASALAEAIGPIVLAAAIVGVAGALAPVNERELRRRRERMATLHSASVAFVGADDAASLRGIAEGAARTLLPGWDITVRLGSENVEERRWRDEGRAFLEVPIVARNRPDGGERALGAITASRGLSRVGRAAVRGDMVMALRTLTTALSAALVQHELLARLEHLSMSDPLTGLGNRRAFDEALAVEMARARRAGGPMGIVILDVDRFKQFNDRYGHQAGDDALVAVAQVLAHQARAEDRACRIGGEEFALLLPGADDAATVAVAERVRHAIQHQDAPVTGVTVSLGVATSRGDDPKGLLAIADARLYAAKAAGRNRVVSV